MTRWNRPYVFLSIALVAFGAVDLKAQLNRGIIEGIVTDPQGAVIPGVAVTVTSVDRNESLRARSNSAGLYRVVDLISGKYRAHFEASGFAAMEVIDIEVPAGEVIRVDAKLQIGSTRQEVQVTAAPSLLETGPTNASSTIGTRTIDELPLAGRDLQQLVFLVPGVSSVAGPPGTNFGFNSQYGTFPDPTHILGTDVAVSGGQAGANAWFLDGNLNLSGVSENVVVNPSPDAVQEFQAITNSLSAEYGRTGGGVFNVVLKSGTNALHGNVYEYIRNDATNARNPFTSIDSQGHIIKSRQLRFNNFGGTLGGPVLLPHLYNGKDKTFFFFSWDASILHLLGNQPFTVPTALMRRGDFSESPNTALYGIYDPFTSIGPASDGTFARSAFGTPLMPNGCTGQIVGPAAKTTALDPTSSTCRFSTVLPSGRLDPIAMYFMNSFPLPNYNNPLTQQCPKDGNGFSICSNYLGAVGSSLHNHNISLKIDHQWSAKSRYFGEWLFNPGKYNNYRLPWTGPTAQFSGWGASSFGYGADHPVDFANQIISFGNTYSIRPTLINEFRVSFSRQFMTTTPSHPFPDSLTSQKETEQVLAPLKIYTSLVSPVPDWYMGEPGGSIHFGPNGYDNQITGGEAYTLLDNVTKVAGKHTLKAGVLYRLDHFFWEGELPTSLSFSGGLTSNPLTGLGGEGGLDQFLLGAVGPNTGYSGLTLGHEDSPYLRWGYWGTYFQDDFHVTPRLTLNLGLRYDWFEWFRSRYVAGDTNFCFSCPDPTSGFIGKVVRMKGRNIWPTDPKDIGPRINFSWSPFANQKTVIRGGYDLFYSNVHSILAGPDASLTETGHSLVPSFPTSWTPSTCANYSGQCVIFPLSNTTINKISLAVPPFVPGQVPGNDPNNPLYLHYPEFFGANRDPMVQQWGLEVQRELPGNTSLSVGYIGTHGTHLAGVLYDGFSHVPTPEVLQYGLHLNDVIPITSVYSGLQASKLEQAYGATSLPRGNLLVHYPLYIPYGTENFNGTTIYHALNVRFQKRYSQGLNFIASYTYSKKIDNAEIGQATDEAFTPFGLGPAGRVGVLGWQGGHGRWLFRDPDNRRIDRSIAADDIPQMLNVAATYELPFGAGRHFLNRKGVVNQTLGGWRLTANLNAQSGVPLLITCPGDTYVSLESGFGQDWYDGRCNLIGNPKFPRGRPKAARIADWINAAAFEPSFGSDQTFWANYNPHDPRAYTIGNADVFIPGLRSPGFWNIDTSLGKQFHVTESKYFEFRWEALNALNHQNLGYPNTGFCLPPTAAGTTDLVHQAGCSFGRITNIQTDPRSMQFALKFFW